MLWGSNLDPYGPLGTQNYTRNYYTIAHVEPQNFLAVTNLKQGCFEVHVFQRYWPCIHVHGVVIASCMPVVSSQTSMDVTPKRETLSPPPAARGGEQAGAVGRHPPNGGLAKSKDVFFREIINFFNITYNSGQMAS